MEDWTASVSSFITVSLLASRIHSALSFWQFGVYGTYSTAWDLSGNFMGHLQAESSTSTNPSPSHTPIPR